MTVAIWDQNLSCVDLSSADPGTSAEFEPVMIHNNRDIVGRVDADGSLRRG